MKKIKTEPIYNGYTPETQGRYVIVWKGRKYAYVQINSVKCGHHPVMLKYAVSDTDRVLVNGKLTTRVTLGAPRGHLEKYTRI